MTACLRPYSFLHTCTECLLGTRLCRGQWGCSRHHLFSAHVPSPLPLQCPPAQDPPAFRARAWEIPPFILPPTVASTNNHWALVDKYPSSFPEVHSTVPRVPSTIKLQVPTGVTGLAAFPPASLPQPSPLFPGVPSHINYLHLGPGLRMCFWGNPDQEGIWRLRSSEGSAAWGLQNLVWELREKPLTHQEVASADFQARPELSLKGQIQIRLNEEQRQKKL